ncbi:hypothetical protein HHI36_012408 [Cryptolaemus montrouzieri]|uniref:EF-hand domain-containing protein n=1 Tax=Cryptolaemus montrouzieri TaxID=559131 RepID=A0ABD2NFC0_9CUCU
MSNISSSSHEIIEHPLIQEEDIEEFYEAFSHYRINDTEDVMKTSNFPKFLRLMGQNNTEAEMIQMLKYINALDKETITFQEVFEIMKKHFQTPHTVEEIQKAFHVFDRNGDGRLSTEEIRFVMTNLGEVFNEDEVREMFFENDTDRDGRITLDDFMNLMCRGDSRTGVKLRSSIRYK